jgi:hypothetical protein
MQANKSTELKFISITFCVFASISGSSVMALECPKQPSSQNTDIAGSVNASVAKVKGVGLGEIELTARRQAVSVLEKFPSADRLYLEQMLLATYCSSLHALTSYSEAEKFKLLSKYIDGVREVLNPIATGAKRPSAAISSQSPKVSTQKMLTKRQETKQTNTAPEIQDWLRFPPMLHAPETSLDMCVSRYRTALQNANVDTKNVDEMHMTAGGRNRVLFSGNIGSARLTLVCSETLDRIRVFSWGSLLGVVNPSTDQLWSLIYLAHATAVEM